jgi:LETM1 and EF-hand domain-containing protein 1
LNIHLKIFYVLDIYKIYNKNCGAICLNTQPCTFSNNLFYSSNRFHPVSSLIVTKLEFFNPNIRQISSTTTLFSEKPSSKVEETVNAVKEKAQKGTGGKEVVTVKSKKTIKQKIIDEVMHYYHGFKLLGLNAKISFKLGLKKIKGHELTRREHNLVSYLKCSLDILVYYKIDTYKLIYNCTFVFYLKNINNYTFFRCQIN